MPWFKVDDNLAFHAKVVAAGNPAMGLWVRAGSWCAQQLTDGFLPDHMLPAFGTSQQAKRLVDNRLWDRVEGGYRFHEWTERQPSKGDVEAERAAARDRMREFRAKKKGTAQKESPQVSDSRSPEPTPNEQGTSPEVREMFGNPDPTRPDPTRPDPNKERSRKRATQLPADFQPNESNIQLAISEGVDLRREFDKFCDHNRAKGQTYKDWHLALNNWIRKAAEYGGTNVRPFQRAQFVGDQPIIPIASDDRR